MDAKELRTAIAAFIVALFLPKVKSALGSGYEARHSYARSRTMVLGPIML